MPSLHRRELVKAALAGIGLSGLAGRAVAADEPPDYIVVGSGAGGGTVAARLAERGYRVLVARGRRRPADVRGGNPLQPTADTMPDDYDVPAFHPCRPRTTACAGTSSCATTPTTPSSGATPKYIDKLPDGRPVDGVLYPRAGTLGGCTAHNAMILVYPHNADWNQLADLPATRRGAPRRCAATSSASRTAAIGRLERVQAKLGWNPEPARLVTAG